MRPAPWHVKGVAPAARETAHEAARRSGLSVGEWLNSLIFGSADQPPPPRQNPPRQIPLRPRPPHRQPRHLPTIDDRLDDLTRQIDRLAQAKPPAREAGDDALPRRLADAIDRLDQRLDQMIEEGRHANSEMERRVVSVDRALAALGQERLRGAFVAGSDNVEQAVTEIAARQRALDADLSGPDAYAPPPRFSPAPTAPARVSPGQVASGQVSPGQVSPGYVEPDLSGLERQLQRITTQIESLQRPCRVDEAVAALRQDLADVGRTLSEAMPRQAVEALDGQVRKLAAQLEAGHEAGAGGAAVAGLERGLAEVRDALHSLTPAENLVGFDEAVKTLSRKVDVLASNGQDPGALQQLESAVVALRGIVANVASGEALAALAADVRVLTERIERAPAPPANEFLINLERRIGAIAEAIESVRYEGSRAVPPALDAMMRSLSEQLERLALTRTDQLALGNLEERITRLVEKLDASEARLGHLGAIERGMAELLVHLEEMRSGQTMPAARAPSAVAPPELPETIRPDTADIPPARATSGRRAEDSLEAVHGTIGDVVSRLAMIESDLRTETKPPGRPADAPAPFDDIPIASPPPSPPAAPLPPAAALSEPSAAPRPASPAGSAAPTGEPAAPGRPKHAAPPRPPIDSSLPPDYPLEPGSGPPRGAIGGKSPADRIAASEAPLRAAKAAPPPEGDSASNFLQAARRAAKAAAEQDAPRSGAVPADPNDPNAASKTLSQRMKQLFVGVGIVFAIAGAFRFAGIYLDPDRVILADAPAPQNEFAQLPADLPSTARAIAVPDQFPSALPVAAPPRLSSASAANVAFASAAAALLPAPMSAPMSASMPAPTSAPMPGVIAAERLAPPAAAVDLAPRNDITGSVPARPPASASLAEPAEPAPPPPAVDQVPSVIGKGLLAAANAGDPVAAYEMATHYADGRGVAQSYKDAAVWYERAAKRGLVPAQFRLGTMYEKGLGVSKDLQEARRRYLAAADKGNAKAMHNLAVLYAEGIDGKPDYKSAVGWFRKAANYAVADSQYNLAVLYARGIGIEQNLSEAFKWFSLAANSGDHEAGKKRDEIAARLDKDALAAARLATQSWTAEVQPEAATTVKFPPDGWEQAAVPAAKTKPRPRAAAPSAALH